MGFGWGLGVVFLGGVVFGYYVGGVWVGLFYSLVCVGCVVYCDLDFVLWVVWCYVVGG